MSLDEARKLPLDLQVLYETKLNQPRGTVCDLRKLGLSQVSLKCGTPISASTLRQILLELKAQGLIYSKGPRPPANSSFSGFSYKSLTAYFLTPHGDTLLKELGL